MPSPKIALAFYLFRSGNISELIILSINIKYNVYAIFYHLILGQSFEGTPGGRITIASSRLRGTL